MDARRTSGDHQRNELDWWLHSCDICIELATNPIAATCGHLFCRSCLNEAFESGLVRRNTCPICSGELLEETAHRFPIVESVAPVGQTRARHTIVSEAAASAGNNITMTEPRAAAGMRSSLISEARMDVVQDMIDAERERTHSRQLDLMRLFSNLRGQRIRELEQALENMVQMNLALLREMEDRDEDRRRLRRDIEDRDEDNRRLRRRIAELGNPTTRAGNIGLGLNFEGHRRFGRRITPTLIVTRHAIVNFAEEQPIPESVEGGSSSMNSEAGA